jgi:transcriptional regulator with XRE-family HTH domain
MATIVTHLAVGEAVRRAREERGMTVAEFAKRSGVSRAMITKIENDAAQPTAVLLGRLSGALGITLSSLVARAEREDSPVARVSDQPVWVDPATGYLRRALSPNPGGRLELVEIELPAGASIGYPAEAALPADQQLWLLEGDLSVREDRTERRLTAGDCLALTPQTEREYRSEAGCRYLVAYAR